MMCSCAQRCVQIFLDWGNMCDAMGPIPMLIPEDYEQMAERCARLANASSEPTVAEALSALALDYFARAERLRCKAAD
jgi:hypothetical protein